MRWLVGCLLAVAWASEESPETSTGSGRVRGRYLKSRDGVQYAAFTRIPYAKPPVGPLRFKVAEPAEPWEGVMDGTQELPLCTQVPVYDPFQRDKVRGQEDCLYLNVFSPKLEGSLPVMVYLHGGGWRSGFPGAGPATRAKYMMDFGVVLVTFNYRLGPLGFLSTEDKVLPGNLGLKDQAAVLRWIRDNISHFGGDPSKVTVFGESAGGASAHYTLISPLTKDLVVGGISQSGVGNAPWAFASPGLHRYRAHKLAATVQCPQEPHEELLECLRGKTAEEITATDILLNRDDYVPLILYEPTMEAEGSSDAPYLTGSPFKLPVTKPWMVGFNSGEGAFKILSFIASPKFEDNFYDNLEDYLPETLMYSNTSSDVGLVTDKVIERFFPNKSRSNEKLSEMFDGVFHPTAVSALAMSRPERPWFFLFDHRGKTSATDLLAKGHHIQAPDYGVSHTDELFYLFSFEEELPDSMSEQDHQVSRRLLQLWTNFAKNQKPTEDASDWPRYEEDTRQYLRIGTDGNHVKEKLREDALHFWQSLPLRDKMEALDM